MRLCLIVYIIVYRVVDFMMYRAGIEVWIPLLPSFARCA